MYPLSFEDVLALEDAGLLPEGRKLELEDGVLVDVTPGGPEHDGASTWLNMHVARARSAWEVRVGLTLRTAGGYLLPDVMVVGPLPRTQQPWSARRAVEITTTSHARDRHKAGRYAKALVHECWMVDLVAREVIVHRGTHGERYDDVTRHAPGTLLAASEGIDPVDISALLG